MKKETKKEESIIDLDSFNDVSLYQLIPSGKGFGLALLKTYVDAVHNGAKINSLLISGKEGLQTHASAFLRALAIDNYNQTDASFIQTPYDLYIFLCGQQYEGYVISSVERLMPSVRSHLCEILTKKVFRPYNYMEQKHDTHEVQGIIIMTTKNIKIVPEPIVHAIQHICEIETFTPEQLELVILQRLKYAKLDYEDESILKDIVRYGESNLNKCIRFLECCISVIQADCRNKLLNRDIIKVARFTRIPNNDDDSDIPF